MANQEHLTIFKQGVEVWNRWRKAYPKIQPDLSEMGPQLAYLVGADLSKTNLQRASLFRANFFGANLREANLYKAFLNEANCNQANLSRANLTEADLTDADLRRVDLSFANLTGANLSQADLSFANLNGAEMHSTYLNQTVIESTIFGNMDLREVNGLEFVVHRGPSEISISTIYCSQADIPEIFLRGAGVPASFIEYMHSLTGSPLDFYSCFISYASHDEKLAHRLHEDLQGYGVRCWFAPEDLKIGDKIRSRIDEAIYLQDKLLLILSRASVASDWVEHEVEMALAKERKEQRTVLFPVRVDRAILDQEDLGWPALVRHERHIGDFTTWTNPQAYQQAFERLLRDLKKADEPQDEERKP